MVDVIIHRCTLRVVRRGGWNWGADPRHLAQNAVRALPQILARKLSELLPEDEDRDIAAPVRIQLSVRISELLAELPSSPSAGSAEHGPTPSSSLDRRMESAVRAAFGLKQALPEDIQVRRIEHRAIQKSGAAPHPNTSQDVGALSRLLLAWLDQGVLERRLVALPFEQIDAWHSRLCRNASAPVVAQSNHALHERIAALVLAHSSASSALNVAERYRGRILIATTAAEQLHLPVAHRELWRTLNRLFPEEPRSSTQQTATSLSDSFNHVPETLLEQSSDSGEEMQTAATDPSPAPVVVAPPSAEWEVRVGCVLPFIVLGPLARLGYLETLAGVLEAARLSGDAPLFAAALAYKVLDPPQRGWRRSQASTQAAAAFAGLTSSVPEDSLVDFARRMEVHTPALDLILADALIAGHTPGERVTLQADGTKGLMLLDTQGCFPIAWAAEIEPLLALLNRLGNPIVLISGDSADRGLLSKLDAAGATFVVNAPPTRSERWQRIIQRPDLLKHGLTNVWTNFSGLVNEPFHRAAAELQAASEEAGAFTRELVLARPGVVRAASPDLDRSQTLAAAVALGMISWKLWQDRGRTSPQQLLERYADLEGRVRFNSSTVSVVLPLGRRNRELYESGLLAPIDGAPWLGGRRIEFGGG